MTIVLIHMLKTSFPESFGVVIPKDDVDAVRALCATSNRYTVIERRAGWDLHALRDNGALFGESSFVPRGTAVDRLLREAKSIRTDNFDACVARSVVGVLRLNVIWSWNIEHTLP